MSPTPSLYSFVLCFFKFHNLYGGGQLLDCASLKDMVQLNKVMLVGTVF